MIYSCFNEQLGMYEYLEDGRAHPLNGDLPIPSFPSSALDVGVPAREAGRPPPPDARKVGKGLEARGIIVTCDNESFQGLGMDPAARSGMYILGGIALIAGLTYLSRQMGW